MVRYFHEMFSAFNEDEHSLMVDMIFRIGNNNLSFDLWRETMTEEERLFSVALEERAIKEYYYHIDDTLDDNNLNLFTEIMLFYVFYDVEDIGLVWALPAVGPLYGEAIRRL